jgi:hypothetical protein
MICLRYEYFKGEIRREEREKKKGKRKKMEKGRRK